MPSYKTKRQLWIIVACDLIAGKFLSALGQAAFGLSEIFRHLEKVWELKSPQAVVITANAVVLSCSAMVNGRNRGTILWNLCVPPEKDPNELPDTPFDHNDHLGAIRTLSRPEDDAIEVIRDGEEILPRRITWHGAILHGTLPNNTEIPFSGKWLDPHSEDAFIALKATRKQVVWYLEKLIASPTIHEKLAEEIQYNFEKKRIISAKGKILVDSKNAKEAQLNTMIATIKTQLPAWQANEGESLLNQERRLINLLDEHKKSEEIQQIITQVKKLSKAESALKEYCRTEDAFAIYFAELEDKLPLGYIAASLYAQAKGISFHRWQQQADNPNKLALVNYHPTAKQRHFIHILSGEELIDFNLLLINRSPRQESIRAGLQNTLTTFAGISASFASANGFLGGVKAMTLIWYCLKYILFWMTLMAAETLGDGLDDINFTTKMIFMFYFGINAVISSLASNISWNFKNSAEVLKEFAEWITDPNISAAEKRSHAWGYRGTIAWVFINILTTPCFAYFTTSKTFELIGLTGPLATTLSICSTLTVLTTNAANAISSVQKRRQPAPHIKRGLNQLPTVDQIDYAVTYSIGFEDSVATGAIYWVAVVHFFEAFGVDAKDPYLNAFAVLAMLSMFMYNISFNTYWVLVAIFMGKHPEKFVKLSTDMESPSSATIEVLPNDYPTSESNVQMASICTTKTGDADDEKVILIDSRISSEHYVAETHLHTNGHTYTTSREEIYSLTTSTHSRNGFFDEHKKPTRTLNKKPFDTLDRAFRDNSMPVTHVAPRTPANTKRRKSLFDGEELKRAQSAQEIRRAELLAETADERKSYLFGLAPQ